VNLVSEARKLDAESSRWIADLGGAEREAAVRRLHGFLHRVATGEVHRRRGHLPFGGPELDDIASQAADDATLQVTAKLADFRGESRFTTWAAKFSIFEVSNKTARHLWRRETNPIDLDAVADRDGLGPVGKVETDELMAALGEAIAGVLTAHQKRVFEAAVINSVPLDVLALELGVNRNAIYKVVFDCRRKLRAVLESEGLLDPS
jgi:RNA polymerase sigma-70 factor, ECF subfamily